MLPTSDHMTEKQTFTEKDNSKFRKREYWETRFEKEETYEWLVSIHQIIPLLRRRLPGLFSTTAVRKVLVVGCGNSDASFELWRACSEAKEKQDELTTSNNLSVTSMDYSVTVIENMRTKYPELTWIVQDMTDMKDVLPNSFDYVLDKAAMDALVVDEGDPWNPNSFTKDRVARMMTEINRILKPGGTFIQVSFQQPHFRKAYLQTGSVNTEIETEEIQQGLGYFYYEVSFCGSAS